MLLIYTFGEEFPFFLYHQKDFNMTTMVIYNENVLESFMAAACIASIMPVTVSECKSGNVEGKVQQDFFGRIETPFRLVNNKVILPSDQEQADNPRSRSAKLRIAEKK
jgi:hypothetical protein